jgi:hypothetical protein
MKVGILAGGLGRCPPWPDCSRATVSPSSGSSTTRSTEAHCDFALEWGRRSMTRLEPILDEEQRSELTDIMYYRDFASRVRAIQKDLLYTLPSL